MTRLQVGLSKSDAIPTGPQPLETQENGELSKKNPPKTLLGPNSLSALPENQ